MIYFGCEHYKLTSCTPSLFRHGQMNIAIFDAFDTRGKLVQQHLAGGSLDLPPPQQNLIVAPQGQQHLMGDIQPQPIMHNGMGNMGNLMGGSNNMADFFGGPVSHSGMPHRLSFALPNGGPSESASFPNQRAQRNPSILSFGGGRNMSFASEASYGRAMSGLSALSIDWENMDDFDINVDHSAHINNPTNPAASMGGGGLFVDNTEGMLDPKPIAGNGARRSSLRVPFSVGGPATGGDNNDPHVSFKI